MLSQPKVLISSLAMTKINYWVQESNIEISGLGKCIYDKEKQAYHVSDVYLLEQENTGASTDIDAGAVAKLLYETREVEGHLNFWWHSHVNMGVFWSGTDQATIEEFGTQGFCLATVFNKKREMKSAFFQGATDFLPAIFIDDLETQEYTPVCNSVLEQCKKEMDEKCKTYAPKYLRQGGLTGKYQGTISNGKKKKKTVGTTLTSTDLGFEFTGTEYQWEKLVAGEYTYAGFPFADTTIPSNREHGSVHPKTYIIWDDNFKQWLTFDSYKKANPDDCTSVIFKNPFNNKDWLKMCKLYRGMFNNPPTEMVDVEEFFVDMMDLDFSEFWHPNPVTGPIIHKEFTSTAYALKQVHLDKKGA